MKGLCSRTRYAEYSVGIGILCRTITMVVSVPAEDGDTERALFRDYEMAKVTYSIKPLVDTRSGFFWLANIQMIMGPYGL